MAKKFATLRSGMPQESQVRAKVATKQMLEEMPLHALRHARDLSQSVLADVLHMQPLSVAQMEMRADMYIATLRSHVEAMGGKLEVVARFQNGSVKISSFF